MKAIAFIACAALSAATLALAQTTDQPVPQPQPGPKQQSSDTPPAPSRSDPSMTTMQQPISGNSSATSPQHSMAPNAAEPDTRLAAVLPGGMTRQEACKSFKTTNECAAALHAAHDLNIPFEQLRDKMAGGQKLGPAIHALQPGADVKTAVRRAEQEAHNDLKAPQG